MTPLEQQPDTNIATELWSLAERVCAGTMTARHYERLNVLLLDDERSARFYATYLRMHGLLAWNWRDGGEEEDSGVRVQDLDLEFHPSSSIPHPSSIPPIIIDPSPTLHSPVGSFVFSHLAAAVILGIGLLIGLAWRISLPSSEGPAPDTTNIAQAVGRITALADCKWHTEGAGVGGQGAGEEVVIGQWPMSNNPPSALRPPPFVKTVYLGDRFLVASGLMEITYDTGAKVILEGPCTYEIDSVRSGYLAVGKLTARVEKGSGVRDQGSGATQPSAFSLQPSALFAVRTPTAVVTDLGTEFGVEVEENGATRSHVFQGSVELRSSNSRRLATAGESVEILHAGESARVERGRNSKAAVIREPGRPDRFVRRIPSSLIPHSSSQSKYPSSIISHSSSFAYRLTDLGTLGGKMSRATAINAAGHVVGESINAFGAPRAFLYKDGRMEDLGTLGGEHSSASGVNSLDQVVGVTTTSQGGCFPFVYSDGVMTALDTLGGPTGFACGINDRGDIVGVAQNPKGVQRAFLFAASGGMKDLGAFGGPDAESWAYEINAAGQVAGYAEAKDGVHHAFLYSDQTGMEDIGALGGKFCHARRINNAGQVVGISAGRNDAWKHAFLYSRKTGMKDLGVLDGPDSCAFSINIAGQVVGEADAADGSSHAFLFSDGRLVDLNSLVDPAAGWILKTAIAINDFGQIVGFGTAPDGNTRTFLLTPVKRRGARDQRLGAGNFLKTDNG